MERNILGYKELLITISILLGLRGYVPYFRDMFAGKTKPHIFSWFIRMLLTGIAFFGQLSDGAGLGAQATGFAALGCFVVVCYAATHESTTYITRSDTYSFLGALTAIGIRIVTKDVLRSMILVTCIDALGFYPTYRKGRQDPSSETAITYTLSGVKFIFALGALSNFSIVTVLYPASLIIMNCSFAILLYSRRKYLRKNIDTAL